MADSTADLEALARVTVDAVKKWAGREKVGGANDWETERCAVDERERSVVAVAAVAYVGGAVIAVVTADGEWMNLN